MSDATYHEEKAAAAYDRHAMLARMEKANPWLIDNAGFQRRRRIAYQMFIALFSRGAA